MWGGVESGKRDLTVSKTDAAPGPELSAIADGPIEQGIGIASTVVLVPARAGVRSEVVAVKLRSFVVVKFTAPPLEPSSLPRLAPRSKRRSPR